ncbi:MAG: class I SAM-dependent methyltransferase [Methanomicrobiaceae archaeon]|nr:class I SAM-dependent methyltransferase [Methanomicrobiaceae archaeon]
MNKNNLGTGKCPICMHESFSQIFEYTSPPKGEIRFSFSSKTNYNRRVIQCNLCGHYLSIHKMDDSSLYSEDYVNANYNDNHGIQKTYEKIMALPPHKSDNSGRVQNILEFTDKYFMDTVPPSEKRHVLDIGSGLSVFPSKMKTEGWDCTAVDPDPRAIEHALKNVGIKGICGDFFTTDIPGTYDLITFNKVLEHVKDPEKLLAKAKNNVSANGLVYIEVPDGELAAIEGKEREEFFIDHPHIFSFASLSLLVKKSGFFPIKIERLKEPSTKYTLRAFAIPCND